MSVVIETTVGDITVDLYLKERPNACLNFLKLCRIKYYNLCIFYKVERNFIAQTGDPTATGRGGESIFSHLYGEQAKYFDSELKPRLKHEKMGTLSMVNNGNNMNGSQFFLTLGENLTFLDEVHTVFGEVVEGFDILLKINEAICNSSNRPYQDIRITHTVVLHDPYDDPAGLQVPDASPVPTKEQLDSGYIRADEEIDDTKGKNPEEIEEKIKDSEARARATILEMVGDLPDADVKPPENVLFVCKLNPVTTSEDLEVIFSRFGKIVSCEVIKDRKSGDSLQYAFVEFEREEDCENAYFKMDNVLIDDRRIHVDFSQSVSKMNWEKEAKAKLKGLAKGQKFAIKGPQRKSDGYDMVFDMDNASGNRNDNRKPRDRSPDRRNKKPTSASYNYGNRSKYSDVRRQKDTYIEDDQHYSSRKSNRYPSSERSRNGRPRDIEIKSHVSRSQYKKASPKRSQCNNSSSDRSVSEGRPSQTTPKHLKKRTRHDSSSSSHSSSPAPTKSLPQASRHKKEKHSKKSVEPSKSKYSEAAPLRHPDKKKKRDSSSSSSDSPSSVRKTSKSFLSHSTARSRSPESTNYKKRSSKPHSQSPEPFYPSKKSSKRSSTHLNSRSQSPEISRKTSSKHKPYKKRKSSSPEQLPSSKREYSNKKSIQSESKYDKKQTSHKSSNTSKKYSQYSDDSSDTNCKQYKNKGHKSSSKDQHKSRNKHSHKEHKRRRRSSS